jgi:hypothetical protein
MNRFSRRLLLPAKLSPIGPIPQALLVYPLLKIYTNKNSKLTFLAVNNDGGYSLQVKKKCKLKEPKKRPNMWGMCIKTRFIFSVF